MIVEITNDTEYLNCLLRVEYLLFKNPEGEPLSIEEDKELLCLLDTIEAYEKKLGL